MSPYTKRLSMNGYPIFYKGANYFPANLFVPQLRQKDRTYNVNNITKLIKDIK